MTCMTKQYDEEKLGRVVSAREGICYGKQGCQQIASGGLCGTGFQNRWAISGDHKVTKLPQIAFLLRCKFGL
jgi:hypothetical protein